MKSLVIVLSVVFACGGLSAQTFVWQPSPGHTQVRIWPGTPPHVTPVPGPEYATNEPTGTGQTWVSVNNVSQPTMTVYSPKGTNTGVAVVVFPGGGYSCLAIDIEGTEICDWLNSRGITAVLLKYRVPVKKVGPYGESCRPDFAIALYPGHLWNEDKGFKLNPNVPVTTKTPPTFLLQNEDDHVDNINDALVYYIALKNTGVPVEFHSYAQGGHAFGLRPTKFPVTRWPQLAETWLKTIGMIPQ